MRNSPRGVNPVFKLTLMVSFTINIFLIDSYTLLFAFMGIIVLAMIIRGIKLGAFKYILALIAAGSPLTILIFVFAGIETSAGGMKDSFLWVVHYYTIFTLRMILLVLGNIILVRTTSVKDITDTLRSLGVKEKVTLFIVTLVRFIPLSIEQGKRIIEVQRARGLKLKSLYKPKNLLKVFVPLFISHLKMTGDTALMLEIRYFSWNAGAAATPASWISLGNAGVLFIAAAIFFLPKTI